MKSIENILIIQTAFTGDAILATALCEEIHAAYPNCRLELLVRKGNESLFSNHPYLHHVHIWDKSTKYQSLWSVYKGLNKVKWDAIINLQRFGSTGFITWLLKARLKVGFSKNPFSFSYNYKIKHTYNEGLHEVDRNAQLLSPLGIKSASKKPKLYPGKKHISTADQLTEGSFITISPASVWETKKLPFEKWVELCDQQHKDLNIYILGAPSDKGLGDALIEKTKHSRVKNLCGSSDLLTSAAIMQKAMMNYVNDSAPTHLASSVNAPVTTFYCSTVPRFGFGPLSSQSHIIETQEKLACRPCGIHGHKACPEGHFKCGTTIALPDPLTLSE